MEKVKKLKSSRDEVIDEALKDGGVFYKNGVKIFVDNPDNFNLREVPTGYWIKTAMGFTCYFKNTTRQEAQKACNDVFGAGRFTVNSKV